ncbi:MAG: hypothetical protein K6G81_11790, partial [Lachnospiraceae bacterium]|nr:hypothetical protein [Lachnospiraceae bacterium]
MRKRRMITKCRQIMAFLMALLVTLTCAPQTALAYIGAVRDNSGSADETLKTGTFTYNGDTYMYIENEYLHFDICVASKKGERVGKYCHTIPTASLPRKNGNKQYTNLDSFGVQTISHTISVKRQHAGNWSDMSNIKVSSYSTAFVDDYEKENTGSGNLGDKCIFLEGTIDNRPIREYFTLVRVDGGEFDNEYFYRDHILADNGETNNWGVRARGTCGRSSKINYSGEDGELIMPETSDFYRMTLDYQKFPIMGHPGVDVAAPVISAQTIRGEYVTGKGYPTKKINIDAGIDFTSAHTILEVYSDSYSFAAPFVAASSKYSGDVDGHDSFTYPEKVRYKDFALHALGNYEQNHMTYGDHHANDDSRVSSYALWGYRKLYTYDQINGTPEIQNQVNDNYVKVEGKDYLYITKKGGVTSVNVASNYASIPNNALAYYYGDYTTDKNGYYYFKENVQLSPTITMNWDKNDTSIKVYLKSDGTFVFPADKVTLESPAFTFYEPKADADPGSPTAPGLAFKGYDVWDSQNQYTQKGLVLDMNPDKNNAILSFALPSNEVSAKRVAINKSGEVVFSGRLALDLFLAEMDMQRLSYSKNKQGKFMVNGLEAKGALKAPEGELDWKIFNFGGTNITGDISTFKDNEHYSFELTISAKDLFETNAELDLRRLNNGRLVPNNLSFDLAVKKDGIGLDITPSTPVVTLTGGGGGVYNIADQMNGNYLSIPPVIVKLTGTGQVLKVMEGKLDLYVGPSKLSLESKDIGFKIPGRERINIIKGLSAGYNLNDAVITYNGNKYQGYRFGGNISADLSLIPEKSANTKIKKLFVDTVTASLALGANVTVAENHQIQQAYASMGLSGSGGCSFQIPIIKYEVVSGKLEMKIEGVGEYPRNGNPLKNMEAKGGIVATGQLGKALYGQVVYLIPDTITVDGGFGQADNYDWDQLESQSEAILASHGGMAVEGQPVLVDMEDGSQMLAVFATNTYPITASVKDASETGDDEIVSETASVSADSVSGNAADTDASDDADEAIDVENDASYSKEISIDKNQVEDGECVILMAIPKDQADMTALMESIGATSLVGWTKVTPSRKVVTKPGSESETVSEITNNEDMTVWDGAYEYSDDGTNTVESEAVYLSIPKETIPANGI